MKTKVLFIAVVLALAASCGSGGGPVAECGNGSLEAPEECDDGNTIPGDGCDATCLLEACGNGVVDAGEECDDGNTTPGDGCDAACLLEACGNGTVDAGEECDDGGREACDGCSATCTTEIGWVCGDGAMNATCGEECDDGNTTPGDGCDAACLLEACGNGIVDAGEECDDGGREACDGCSATCTTEIGWVCGDGAMNATCGEECDDGNTTPGDGCDAACLLEACGNGIVDAGEECDDGGREACDGCSATCTTEIGWVCGDGAMNATCGEECDDGNTTPGDGCNEVCQVEIASLIIGGDYMIDIDTTLDTCRFGSGSAQSPMNVDERNESEASVAVPFRGTSGDCNRLNFVREGNVLTRFGSSEATIARCEVQIDVTTILEFFDDDTVTGSEINLWSATGGDCSDFELPCTVELVITGQRCTDCFGCIESPAFQGANRPGLFGPLLRQEP